MIASVFQDIDYFREKPQAFFTLSKDLYPGNFKPTLTHSFLKLLHDKERLLRVFTQNIDTLERLAGLTSDKIVEAHGSFATSRCIRCHHEVEPDWMRELCLQGQVAYCPRTACKEKSGKKGSLVKPDIVFFGEGLPDRFFSSLRDLKKADLLIVLGTSLQVNPFASLVHQVSDHCPRVLINLERVGEIASYREGGMHFLMNEVGFDFEGWTLSKGKGKEHIRDVFWQGNCDEGILELAEHLGWKDELLSSHQKICAAIDAQNSTTRLPDPADETLNHARDTAAKAASSVAEKTDAGDKESNILSERMAQLDVQCEHHDTTSSPTKESTSD